MMSLRLPVAIAFLALLISGPTEGATAYVSNEGSGTVSAIDIATDKVTATLKNAKKPRGIAIAKDGSRLYLSDQTANALVVVELLKGTTLATIALGSSPEAIYLSPDGKWLSAAIEEEDQVFIIDVATLKIDRKIKMKGKNPEHAVWSPDGKWLYVSAEEADSVDIVDLAKNEVVKSVKVGNRPRGIGFLPDGSRAYVAAENADTVNVFDTATHTVVARIKAGSRSNGVLVHPDGKRVFVTSGGKGSVQVIDTATQRDRDGDNPRRADDPGTWRSLPTARGSTLRAGDSERHRGCRYRHLHEDCRDSRRRVAVGGGNPVADVPTTCAAGLTRSMSVPPDMNPSARPVRLSGYGSEFNIGSTAGPEAAKLESVAAVLVDRFARSHCPPPDSATPCSAGTRYFRASGLARARRAPPGGRLLRVG